MGTGNGTFLGIEWSAPLGRTPESNKSIESRLVDVDASPKLERR